MSVKHHPERPALPWQVQTIFSTGPYATNAGMATSSQAFPSANKAYLYPFIVPETIVAYKLGWVNGTSPTGNADVGIYDEAGTLLVSAGSTARSGSGVSQVVDVADTVLVPGSLYYLTYAQDDTSAVRVVSSAADKVTGMMGVREKAASFALPATISATATANTVYLVLCFVDGRPL